MLELEWSRVDFSNRTVEVKIGNTKGKERRLVPLNNEAYSALLRLRRVCNQYFPDTEWVFTHTKPRYFGQRIQNVRRVFDTAVKSAGIAHVTPHCLRHTSITESAHVASPNVVDISRVAGHKDLKITLGYVDTADGRLRQAVAKLPNIATVGERTADGASKTVGTYGSPG